MGLKLATAMSKMMKPSEEVEMVLFGFLILLILYAARVVYKAPKTMPPKWKKYEEEKRQRKLYEEYERQQKEGLTRRRAPAQPPGTLTPRARHQQMHTNNAACWSSCSRTGSTPVLLSYMIIWRRSRRVLVEAILSLRVHTRVSRKRRAKHVIQVYNLHRRA
jgi:hypothetical protein